MTTPGGDSGENAHDGGTKPGSSGQPPGESERNAAGEPAFSGFEPPPSGFEAPPTPGYPPPAYPPPGYQQPSYPPPGPPPTGYGAPPGYQNESGYSASYPRDRRSTAPRRAVTASRIRVATLGRIIRGATGPRRSPARTRWPSPPWSRRSSGCCAGSAPSSASCWARWHSTRSSRPARRATAWPSPASWSVSPPCW